MKRFVSVLTVILLFCLLAAPVSAAGSAHMSLSATPGSVYRGQTFSVSVYLTNEDAVSRGGIVLSYDASVFEFVGGTCNVSGATLAEVSAGRNGGVFALDSARVVSGTVFTIQMRVKNDAPFGTYYISGSASMEIPCGVSAAAVTVACNHSYGAYSSVDSNTHRRQCSVCLQYESGGHHWNGGQVTQAATCKDSGTMLYTCNDCGQTATETIAPNGNHKYGNWTYVNESGHQGTCVVCGHTVSAAHGWEFVEVTKEPTCTATGAQTLKCDTCAQEKTEEIPVTDHSYGSFETVDGEKHRHSCSDCGHEELLDHSYSDRYTHDERGHARICDGCGNPETARDHIPGPEATANEPQVCTACGRMLKAALNHIHSYPDVWTTDDNGHWYTCEFCDSRSAQQFHSYDSVCDGTCDTCGYVRVPAHDYSDLLHSDETGHWYPCRNCGEKRAFASHAPGPAATVHEAQTCTACGFELAAKLPHAHSYTVEDGKHHHTCACGAVSPGVDAKECAICAADVQKQLEKFPWWIVSALEAVLLAAAAVIILRKKNQT